MSGYALRMLQHLRHYEEVILYGNAFEVPAEEQEEIIRYLREEYAAEAQGNPYQAPPFHPQAALWAARTLYTAAQMLLYREHKATDLEAVLPPFGGERTAAALLSADLALRFLPDLVAQLRVIDPEDRLIAVLEAHLAVWHYSAVTGSPSPDRLDFAPVVSSPCLLQLYVNRVIEHKKTSLAFHPDLVQGVRASLGGYASELWPELNSELIANS